MDTEISIPGEGKLTYDIRFYVLTPDEKHVKIIMNLEAQLKNLKSYLSKVKIKDAGVNNLGVSNK